MPAKHILVIEDDAHIAEGLRLNLMLKGYEVHVAPDGASGLRLWKETCPDLIVLDVMLPGIDGFSVLRHIRLEDERIPILIVSAKGEIDDRLEGFVHGVDDYLPKPFHLDEFLLRIDRLLLRGQWSQGKKTAAAAVPKVYRFGGNRIDFETGTATCRGNRRVHLTGQEIKLLKLFVANRGKPLSRSKLLEIGWGYTGRTATRTLDNFIVRIRRYFEVNPKKPVYFTSLRAVGYLFDHPEEE